MGISHDIISEFVKITNDKKEKPKEETVYATIVQASDGKYVKLDGSDLITPTETTTDIAEGERVTVLIKDHSAIITGNITSPSASANRVNGIVDVVSEKLGVFETIVADKIDVNELNAYKATIENLIAGKAEIEDLKATRAEIGFLDADVAHIKTLVNGNLTSDNILSFNITADKVTMADAFIKDAMVDTLNAAKINAGRLNTNNVVIGSDDGGMLISGATQQFTDKNGKVRIQIGRDSTGDFTFVLYGEDGTGQIINQNGITASAVSDGLIVNDMINNNAAISGGKLDISSVIFEINNENNTAIHSSKIYLDEQNQSLEAAFNSLKTQVDTIVDISIEGDLKAFTEQIQSNTAKIEMNKSSINTLVSEDAVIRKEVSDLEGNLIETTNTLSTKYTTLEQNFDGFKLEAADVYATKSTVTDLENNLTTNYTTTEAMNSAIQQKADSITSTVSSNYNTLNDKFNNYPTTSQMNSAINQKANEITSTVRAYKTGVANLLLNSSEGKGLNNPSSGYHQISYPLCEDLNTIYFHEARYFCLSFTVGYTGSFNNAPFNSISFQNNWATRWYVSDIQKIERVGDNAYRYYMKPLRCASTFVSSDLLTFIGEHGNGNGWFYNVMLTEGEMHPSAYTPSNQDYSNKFSEIKQTTDSITSTVSSNYNTLNNKFSEIKQTTDSITSTVSSNYNTLNNKFSNYPTTTQMNSSITQLANKIETKVDVNGVKSTIQQNPESVRIGFNAISNYFDLNSTRLQVGHSDGSYTQIGQNGIVYYDAHANWRYHSLMKQGWLGDISGTSWSRTITLPPSFKGKIFSVIVSVEMVNAVNTHDVIKHYKVTVPHDTVNYDNGTFVINMSALAYYVPGQASATAITTNVSWIAIA